MTRSEAERLLGRPERPRCASGASVAGRRVLVTGAGGTIGSALVHRLAESGVEHLTLLGHGELPLLNLDRWLPTWLDRTIVLADVRDAARMREVIHDLRPDIVFHAAAVKHVRFAEEHPDEAALTNIIGTTYVVRACQQAGVSTMVLISTDKAVDAVSVMGASKRAAELVCLAQPESPTRFVVLRLVNVLGSSGSVLPLFQRQLAAGGPLTVTSPEAERYFMTEDEAADAALATLDVEGRLFAPEPGESLPIVTLAHRVIDGRDIEIHVTGLGRGERLRERLFHDHENPIETSNGLWADAS